MRHFVWQVSRVPYVRSGGFQASPAALPEQTSRGEAMPAPAAVHRAGIQTHVPAALSADALSELTGSSVSLASLPDSVAEQSIADILQQQALAGQQGSQTALSAGQQQQQAPMPSAGRRVAAAQMQLLSAALQPTAVQGSGTQHADGVKLRQIQPLAAPQPAMLGTQDASAQVCPSLAQLCIAL